MSRGQDCLCLKARHERKLTEPPRRYSEATLLGAMERAGRDLEEEELSLADRAILAAFFAFMIAVAVTVVWSFVGMGFVLYESIPKLFVLYGS